MKRYILSLIGILLWMMVSCAPKIVQKDTGVKIEPQYPEKKVLVVATENIRDEPNGYVIGELNKGDSVLVLNKLGNWVVYDYYPDEKGYVWGPSLGYDYLNLYDPVTYIDTTQNQFKPVSWINHILGQKPDTIQNIGNLSHVKYKNLGLGKRVEEVMVVATVKKQVVEKTVKIWIDEKQHKITEVQVDLLNPVTGKQAALKKSGVKHFHKLVEDSDSRIVFQLNEKGPLFYLILKRKQYGSDEIIGYIITKRM